VIIEHNYNTILYHNSIELLCYNINRNKIAGLYLMKKTLLALFLATSPTWATYCIQVVTLDTFDSQHMSSKLSNIFENFNDARVEERGSYLVLRIGEYNSYSQALSSIASVKSYYNDAYIRKCDIDQSRILYQNTTTAQKPHQAREEYILVEQKRKLVQKERYEQPKPQETYYNNTLWKDCQKCFAPIYLEDEESEPQDTATQTKKVKKSIPKEPVLQKKYKISKKTDNDFWFETVDEEKKVQGSYDPRDYPQIDTHQY